MPFNFHLIQTPWDAGAIADLIRDYEAAVPAGAWPNWVMGNHDQHRIATRIGAEQARVAAVLLLTLRGTPTMYYGDELGMPDARIAPGDVQDPAEKNQPGIGQGRDPERSPMLWENRENAGFCPPGIKTWLPLVWDWPNFTVETERHDERSMLALYRRLLALRRALPVLHSGAIGAVQGQNGVLQYTRLDGNKRVQVLLNLTAQPRSAKAGPGSVLLSTYLDQTGRHVCGGFVLRPHEALVVERDAKGSSPA
jgi:alpha-glucosidase